MSVEPSIETRALARALMRLRGPRTVLAKMPKGYGVYANGDRRGRPLARLSDTQVRLLLAEGALRETARGFALSEAGAAKAERAAAAPEEAYIAQHRPLVDRDVIEPDGEIRTVRGVDISDLRRRLERLRGGDGEAWLTASEIEAAMRLRADWDSGQVGLLRGSDWTAAPRSGGGRGPGGAREGALAAGLDARARVDRALAALAEPLRRVVVALCIEEYGFDAFERDESWPTRSAKIALKMALAQLAAQGGQAVA